MKEQVNENTGQLRRERLSLGGQARAISVIAFLLVGAPLFKGERDNPQWVAAREKELEALKRYEETPPGPDRSKAHAAAQEAWRERDGIEAELFDPKPEATDT